MNCLLLANDTNSLLGHIWLDWWCRYHSGSCTNFGRNWEPITFSPLWYGTSSFDLSSWPVNNTDHDTSISAASPLVGLALVLTHQHYVCSLLDSYLNGGWERVIPTGLLNTIIFSLLRWMEVLRYDSHLLFHVDKFAKPCWVGHGFSPFVCCSRRVWEVLFIPAVVRTHPFCVLLLWFTLMLIFDFFFFTKKKGGAPIKQVG